MSTLISAFILCAARGPADPRFTPAGGPNLLKGGADSDSKAALQNLPGSPDQRCGLMEAPQALYGRSPGFRDWIFFLREGSRP